jgi:hypothetical protein
MIDEQKEQIQKVLAFLQGGTRKSKQMLTNLLMLDMHHNDSTIMDSIQTLLETIEHLKGDK